MRPILIAASSGILFGLGLTLSGMINPTKVLGFLDITGDWDPSLALVMIGAIPVAAMGFGLARRQAAPLCGERFNTPTATRIDARLILGAALFGIGWGLVGYCPGPALAAISFGAPATLLFVAAMAAGMAIHGLVDRRPTSRSDAGA